MLTSDLSYFIESSLMNEFGTTDLMSIGFQMLDVCPELDLFNIDEVVVAIHYVYFHDEIPYDEWIEYWAHRVNI
jgi:hypothetical protein